MPVADVLRLQEYRDRRSARLRLSQALHSADSRKHEVFANLVEIAELAGADRAAAVWVDEHGSRLIHPYVVVDQLSARPRRAFAFEPLAEAWQLGVPGARDRSAEPSAYVPATFAVALGSDGTRAWFVVADSVAPRAPVTSQDRDRIMYLAGECAAIVLHRDLDVLALRGASNSTRFAGWDILADLEGREADEPANRRIAQRFVVVRLVRMHLDDDLAAPADRISGQVRRARAEIGEANVADPEAVLWEKVLSALEEGRLEQLGETLVELGDSVEAQGHMSGALELYRCAYEVSAAVGATRSAVEAARLSGRLTRRRADWAEAERWFRLSYDVAEIAGLSDAAARALVGLGGIKKETGNLPVARETLHTALATAERSRSGGAIAMAHHALLGVEQAAGRLDLGLQHGWVAVATYEDQREKLRCLASLAGALADYGDHEAATDAWTVVALASDERYYQVYAYDALAYLAALRGDEAAFREASRCCDTLGWEDSPSAKAEILYYRGLSYRALGYTELAREWLRRAVAFAEENGYNRILFSAEEALANLVTSVGDAVSRATPTAPPELREGLRAMRQELAAVGA